MQSFADEALGDFGAVGVGGVDQVYAEFDSTAEHASAFLRVVGLAPGALAYKTHGSIAETVNGEVAGEVEIAGSGGRRKGHDASDARGPRSREQGNEGMRGQASEGTRVGSR